MTNPIQKIFCSLCLLEIALMTVLRNCAGPYVSPILLLMVGISIGWILLRHWRPSVAATSLTRPWRDGLLCVLLFLAGVISTTNLIKGNLRTTPIRADISDIIPQIQYLVSRWLHGEFPYQPIEFGYSYEFFPVYLPAQWGPFVLFELSGIDYRLGATWLLWSMLLIPLVGIIRAAIPVWRKLLWIALSFVLLNMFVQSDGFLFAVSVEQLIMGYYMLLVIALCHRPANGWLAGALLLCLLSRFALIFWLPLYLIVAGLAGYPRQAFQLAGILAAGVLLLYVLPFMTVEPLLLVKAQHTYTAATLLEWTSDTGQPLHLFQGLGLACYFYDLKDLSLAARVQYLQITSVGVSLLAAIGLLVYARRSGLRISLPSFAIGSLKIMLSIFYAFVQIPYAYLLLAPAGVTIGLLYLVLKAEGKATSAFFE